MPPKIRVSDAPCHVACNCQRADLACATAPPPATLAHMACQLDGVAPASASSMEPPAVQRSHFTRSSLVKPGSWKAAGVLPFAHHGGRAWVLLGGEMVYTGPNGRFQQLMWRDFGGQREAIDSDPEYTAGRCVPPVVCASITAVPFQILGLHFNSLIWRTNRPWGLPGALTNLMHGLFCTTQACVHRSKCANGNPCCDALSAGNAARRPSGCCMAAAVLTSTL